MSESFDPYRVWLGIPPESRPPTHYELLGISPKEHEQAVIEAAVLRQSGYVRNFQIGKYAKDAARVLNEIATAKACLLDRAKRAKYDAELAARQVAVEKATQAAAPPPRVPLAPAIHLDQLVAMAAPSAPPRTGRLTRTGAPRFATFTVKRKQSAFLWQLAIAIAATLAIAGIGFVMLRPHDGEDTADKLAAATGHGADAVEANRPSTTVAEANPSGPIKLKGNFVPSDVPAPEARHEGTEAAAEARPAAGEPKPITDDEREHRPESAEDTTPEAPTGKFAQLRGEWSICYPLPIERSLGIDVDGNVDYSGSGFSAWRGRLQYDGDAAVLVFSDAHVARLRIERAMLVVEENAAYDWPGKVTGVGIGVRAEGTVTAGTGTPKAARRRDGDDAWADFDLHGNSVDDGFARLTTTALSTKESYSGPIDITVVARTDKHSIRISAYGLARLIFNWETNPSELRVHRPNGTILGHATTALSPNTWYRLRWKMTERSVQVFVEDRLVFEERGEYDLTAANPVWIAGGVHGSTIDVNSFTVMRIPAVGVDLPGEVDGTKGGLSLTVAPGFDIAKSWRLSLEFWAPKLAKDPHMIFIWGDDRTGHDAIDLRVDGFTLSAQADNEMDGISGPRVSARLSGVHSRRWVAVRFEYDAAAKEFALILEGKRLAHEHSSIVPTVDRPMPVYLCHAHTHNMRFLGRVRKVRLENVQEDQSE